MKACAAAAPWAVRGRILGRARIQEYERSLRPCLALAHDAASTKRHSDSIS
jgi:hypothetical protein